MINARDLIIALLEAYPDDLDHSLDVIEENQGILHATVRTFIQELLLYKRDMDAEVTKEDVLKVMHKCIDSAKE